MLFSTGTGLERVGVAGPDPGFRLTRDAGYWIVGAGVGLLLRCWTANSECGTSLQKQGKKGGRQGLCPWLLRCLSQSLSERKERMLRGANMSRMEMCIRIGISFFHAPNPGPTRLADTNRVQGARLRTRTLYLIFF